MNGIDNRFFRWVDEHIGDNPDKLRLKYHNVTDAGIDYAAAITQIECRRRFASKLRSTLALAPHFYFPSVLSGEQSTGDRLAAYHATLVDPGCDLVDMTAGLGIDVSHCARRAAKATAIEMNSDYADALAYNLGQLGVANVTVVCGDSAAVVEAMPDSRERTLFIDPARRDSTGARTYALSDCTPDVTALLPMLRHKGKTLIVKASPMIDITQACRELPGVKEAIALGTATECKELLLVVDLRSGLTDVDNVTIKAVTATTDSVCEFAFTPAHERTATADFRMPAVGDYWYEPYPSVMKAGAMRSLCQTYGLSKPSPNTNVFFSDRLVDGFPGHCFKVERIEPFASRVIKRLKRDYPKAEIAARNFMCDAATLRKRLAIMSGGDCRIVGITGPDSQPVLVIVKAL